MVTNGKNTAFQEAIDDRSGDDVFQFDCNSINLILNELNITESPHELIKYGLTKAQATERLSAYGMNAIPSQPRKNWIDLLFEQFDDRLVQILLFVASLSTISSISSLISSLPSDGNVDDVNILESLVEPLIILLILILNAAVGVWQQLSALESMDALEKFQPRLATVLRSEDRQSNSEWISKFDATNIVPGDIIKIRAGDMIPADVKLLSLDSSVLGVDESCLTGESETVLKVPNADFTTTAITKARSKVPISEQSSMAFSGTTVTQGSAKALVVRTGVKTEIGKIHKGVLSVVDTKTPLGIKLDEFGDNLALIIAFICAAVWVVSIPRFDDPIFPSMFDGALYYAKLGVALGVAAIPEGLPAVVTLVLSLGTRRLADRNVIVRKLPSVETLGCVTVICSDKTGTLTTNQMTAVALLTFDRGHDTRIACIENEIQGSSYEPLGAVVGVDIDELTRYPTGAIQDVISVCFGCNNAELVVKDGKCTVIGEPTEGALLCLGEKLSEVNYQNLDTNTINVNKVQWEKQREKIVTLEFDRDRKSMSVLFSSQTHANGKYNKTSVDVLVKGAPNGLLDRCVNIKLRDGDVVTLTEDIRNEIECAISTLSCRPLRCLLLATRQLKSYTSNPASFRVDYPNFTDVETDLTIVGIVGIKDPVRDDVKKSIKTCKDAGIKVIMISGDAKETSTSIAEELHILEENESTVKAFTANEFFSKNDSEQISILKSGNLVFSRTEPIVKQKIVKMLQSNSEITAMTGDGVNDGPALRQASIGVAMGSGSDVAKEAADMILIDDGFSTIVNGIEEGRSIYANMQAFINFLISCNVGEVLAVFLASVMGFPSILSAMQLLWINLATDGPAAVALGFNPPDENVMIEKPRDINEAIITPWFLVRYLIIGSYIGIVTVGIFSSHYQIERGISIQQLSEWSTCHQWSGATSSICDSLFSPEGLALPQTLAISTLITTELLKALCTVSVNSSIFKFSPFKNPYLLVGVTIPFAAHLLILYTPTVSKSFGMVPLSMDQWICVLTWSLPVMLVDEILKVVGNRIR